MVRKLTLVVVRTKDFAKTKTFYQDKLGLKLRYQDPPGNWCHFDAGSVELGIQAIKGNEEIQSPGSIYIAFQVDDLTQLVDEGRKRGIEFTSEITENREEGFKQITASDPEGNKLVFFQFERFSTGETKVDAE